MVQKGNLCQAIPFTQIIYCEVLGRKVYIHQKDGMVMDYYDKLEDLEKRLDSRFFPVPQKLPREPGLCVRIQREDLRPCGAAAKSLYPGCADVSLSRRF